MNSPLYFAIDLKTGEKEEFNTEPINGWDDAYKTSKLLMRRIPKGSFMMGASPMKGENGKLTQISNDFYIAPFETTQAQWVFVMGENPSRQKGDDLPIETITWNDCQEFIKRLNEIVGFKYRLPTEEEWEFACRAGSAGDFGKQVNGEEVPLDVIGWYYGNSGHEMHPVAQKNPNAYGLYDMHGNVQEWTSSLYNPSFPGRVVRGGNWDKTDQYCCAAYRAYGETSSIYGSLGFRLACSLS